MRPAEVVTSYLEDHDPSYVSSDATMRDHGTGDEVAGADAIGSRLYELYNVFFPGAQARVRHLSASDDTVTLEFDFVGFNNGPFMGRPATGRKVEVPMCVVYKIADGAIAALDVYWNPDTMMRQLGMPA